MTRGLAVWILLAAALGSTACARTTTPTPQPPEAANSASVAPARVLAITAVGPRGENRYTPESGNQVLKVAGPLRLIAELSDQPADGLVEWIFQGRLAAGPGRIEHDPDRITRVGTGTEITWSPGRGTEGSLSVIAWGPPSRAGRVGWRSWEIYLNFPLEQTTECPPVTLGEPPRGGDAADYGQVAVDRDTNALEIVWLGEGYLIPLSADPTTCVDRRVAGMLRAAREEALR